MTFQEWLKTDNGRMVTFDTNLKRMLKNVWQASAEAAEARAAALEKERDELKSWIDALHYTGPDSSHRYDYRSNTPRSQDDIYESLIGTI